MKGSEGTPFLSSELLIPKQEEISSSQTLL